MSNQSNQTQPVPNHSLQFYEPKTINGKRVLITIDGRTSFPFGTEEEQRTALNYFKESHHV